MAATLATLVRKKSSMDLVMAPSNLDVLQSGPLPNPGLGGGPPRYTSVAGERDLLRAARAQLEQLRLVVQALNLAGCFSSV